MDKNSKIVKTVHRILKKAENWRLTTGYILGAFASSVLAFAAVSITSFTSGTTISSSDVNTNFTNLKNAVEAIQANGGVSSAMIAGSAVTSAKIADDTIANADISSAAAIAVNKLAAGSSGQVLWMNGTTPTWKTTPAVRVYNSATQSIPSSSATVLTFDTEVYDRDSMHSTAANTGRLTATTAGIYAISCHFEWASNGSAYREASIRYNGSTQIALSLDATAGQHFSGVYTQYLLAAGDYVECLAWQSSGGALNVQASTGGRENAFMMTKIAD